MEQNHNQVWARCLEVISDNISSQAYKTWFAPIKPVKLEDDGELKKAIKTKKKLKKALGDDDEPIQG